MNRDSEKANDEASNMPQLGALAGGLAAEEDPTCVDGSTVFDKGLAAERTMLAWQRTVLGVGVLGALVVRLFASTAGLLIPVIAAVFAVTSAITLLVWVRWRYMRTHRALVETGKLAGRDGKPLVVVTALSLTIAILAVGAVSVR